jgi:5-carboxymethyl-2-hydroxymuconate isomerase
MSRLGLQTNRISLESCFRILELPMPQLQLDFSSNIIEKNNFSNLFRECHSLLEKMLPTDINNCKSRAIECKDFYLGDGNEANAFVHLLLKIMPGRSMDVLENIGEMLQEILKNHFSHSLKKLNLQITLEIMELEKTYFKLSSQGIRSIKN